MTKKNAKKVAARARQEAHGGNYQHHLRQEDGANGPSDRAMEVLVFEPRPGNLRGIVSYVPPGLPNGALDPREGLIMGGISTLSAGSYLLVEPTGRARHVRAERGAGGGAFMAVPLAATSFASVEVIYESDDRSADGMPEKFARYTVIPGRKRSPSGEYTMGVLPVTVDATVKGTWAFGHQAWRQVLALLDAAHPGLQRRVTPKVTLASAGAPAARPTIGLQYPASLPDDALEAFLEPLAEHGLSVPVLREERGPQAGFELLLPTVAVLFMTKAFFDSFFKEAGKDAYAALKIAVSRLWPVFFGNEPRVRVRVVASAPGKVGDGTFSRGFSIMAKTEDGRTIKLLLRQDAAPDELNESVSAFLRFLDGVFTGTVPTPRFYGGVAVVAYDRDARLLYSPEVQPGEGPGRTTSSDR